MRAYCKIHFQLRIQPLHTGSLKEAMMGVLTTWKLANDINLVTASTREPLQQYITDGEAALPPEVVPTQ